MKKKLGSLIPCIAILVVFSTVHFHNLTVYYNQIMEYSGFFLEDEFEKELKKENLRAMESEEEYRKLLEAEQGEEIPEEDSSTNKDLRLYALSALLLDASNNRVLYEENGYKEMPMASTTKIMTCIVTLENANLQDVVTVSSHAARMPDVQLNIRTGEQYYLKDLIYSLMLESHNDAAVAIAEHVGGSVEGFATMMNDKARELGCEHTNFVTPNGLDAPGHHTTAKDLAVIASYAIKNDQFIGVTNTATYQIKEITKGRTFRISNKNRFLYMMEGAIGVKTGFTNGAGYCFVGAVKKSDRTLVSVVLGSGWPPHKSYKWADTKELMDYGIKNFKQKQIFKDIDFEPLLVNEGQRKYLNLVLQGDIKLLLSDEEQVHIEYDIPKVINAPVEKNSIVGYANYYINDILYEKLPIYTADSVERINFKFCLRKILDGWFGFVGKHIE